VCGAYECLWIHDGRAANRKLLASDRPDELGVVFDLTPKNHVASKALGKPVVIAREARPGAYGEIEVLETFDRMMEKGDVIVKITGEKGQKGFEYLAAKLEDAQKVAQAYKKIKEFKVIEGP
jgi:hypothetical protein